MYNMDQTSGLVIWQMGQAIGDLRARVRALEKDRGGRGRRLIIQYAAMGLTAISSVLGITLPEKVAALLKLIAH